MSKIFCNSRENAIELYKKNKWAPWNIPIDVAIIFISDTEISQQYYTKEYKPQYFPNTDQILNLSFDDVDGSMDWEGHTLRGISNDQALLLADFIDSNLGRDFYISCSAGKSRSQGVVRYILDIYPDLYPQEDISNPCLTPNLSVTASLKRINREFCYDIKRIISDQGFEIKYSIRGIDDILFQIVDNKGEYHNLNINKNTGKIKNIKNGKDEEMDILDYLKTL